jgi:hypothetical protein
MADYLTVLRRDIEQFSKGNWAVDNDKLLMYLEELNANAGGGGGGGVPYIGATQNVDLGNYGLFTDFVNFNTAPVASPGAGQIAYNPNTGALAYNMDNRNVQCEIGQQLFAYVTNDEAVQINKGQAVYLYQASGDRASVKLAYNTSDATSAKTFGLAAENIGANQTGFIICQGVLDKLNTQAYNPGDSLYLGTTPGSYVSTKPSASDTPPQHLVYIGTVERANNGNGQIYVRIQNGYELNEIHDVAIGSPNNGDVLTYDNTVTPPLWRNAAPVNDITTYSNNNIVDSVLDSVNYTGATKVSSTGPGTIEVSSNYGNMHYQQISGTYYPLSFLGGTAVNNNTIQANQRYTGFFWTIYIDYPVTISEFCVSLAPTATTYPFTSSISIYSLTNFTRTNTLPYYSGDIVAGSNVSSTVTTSTTSIRFIYPSNLFLDRGVYLVGLANDNTSPSPAVTLQGAFITSVSLGVNSLNLLSGYNNSGNGSFAYSQATPVALGSTIATTQLGINNPSNTLTSTIVSYYRVA